MPAVLASRSSSLPREATNAGLNARHESNLPRQLLDICGLHSARNLRDLSTNSSNADDPDEPSSLSPLHLSWSRSRRLHGSVRPRPLARLPANRKLPSARNRNRRDTLVVRPKIFTRIDLILKRIRIFDFEEWIELIACFFFSFFLKEIDTKQETRGSRNRWNLFEESRETIWIIYTEVG